MELKTDRPITKRVEIVARHIADMAGVRTDGPFAVAVAEAIQEALEAELEEALEGGKV